MCIETFPPFLFPLHYSININKEKVIHPNPRVRENILGIIIIISGLIIISHIVFVVIIATAIFRTFVSLCNHSCNCRHHHIICQHMTSHHNAQCVGGY